MKSKREILEERLKKGWLSNWQACCLVKSSNADRQIRFFKEKPPKDYEMKIRKRKIKAGKTTVIYNEYFLKKVLQN